MLSEIGSLEVFEVSRSLAPNRRPSAGRLDQVVAHLERGVKLRRELRQLEDDDERTAAVRAAFRDSLEKDGPVGRKRVGGGGGISADEAKGRSDVAISELGMLRFL